MSELTLSESEDAVQLAQQLVEEKNQAWRILLKLKIH